MKTDSFTHKERYKFLRRIHRSYQKANKKRKGEILDFCLHATGLARKHLIVVLGKKGVGLSTMKRKGYQIISRYKSDERLKSILIDLWRISDFSCGKLLKPQIKTLLPFYEKEYGEIEEEIKLKLLIISPATVDRLLKQEKRKQDYRRLKERSYSRQKDRFLQNLIPIKTHGEWNFAVDQPGKVQIDLVSHDGGDLRGDFIQTLNMVDYKTGWDVMRACLNKAASNVFPQLEKGISLFPFSIVGIHSDSGSEFINAHLFKFCQQNNIAFTRSRPYKKDDNFWVENRNDKAVRRNVGYKRYEGKTDLAILNLLYEKLYFYLNFFKPQRRCLKKEKIGSKIKKLYDQPQTPYQRVLREKSVTKQQKEKLRNIYSGLNPIRLREEIIKFQNILLEDDKIKKEFIKKLTLTNKEKLDFS